MVRLREISGLACVLNFLECEKRDLANLTAWCIQGGDKLIQLVSFLKFVEPGQGSFQFRIAYGTPDRIATSPAWGKRPLAVEIRVALQWRVDDRVFTAMGQP